MKNTDQQLVIFRCPGCGLQCEADTIKNTLRHQLPTCAVYNKSTKIDFIVLAGVGMRSVLQ